MNRYLEAVKEFHENFDHPVNEMSDEIPLELRQLRIKLIFEELEELAVATDCVGTFNNLCTTTALQPDIVPVAEHDMDTDMIEISDSPKDGDNRDKKEELDALCDEMVVLSGTILAMGYQNVFDEAFEEVQRSNMSKMCINMKEVKDTQQWYLDRDSTESYYIQKDDKYIVLRKSDNKILKNKYYSEADLGKYV